MTDKQFKAFKNKILMTCGNVIDQAREELVSNSTPQKLYKRIPKKEDRKTKYALQDASRKWKKKTK